MRAEALDLIPARMLNEYVFCPRLFYLEFVQREWDDNYFTEDGRHTHRRADAGTGVLPEPEAEPLPFVTRSLAVSAPKIGITGKLDVVEGDGEEVCPVDYKRGAPPDTPTGAYDPERVQVAAYVLALRENGYRSMRGYLYFAGSKQRVEVAVDPALEQRVHQVVAQVRECAAGKVVPGPLVNDARCPGCSLNGICLPDEVNLCANCTAAEPRLLYPARDDSVPLYVTDHSARVGVTDQVLQVRLPNKTVLQEVRLNQLSQVCVLGNAGLTTPAVRTLCEGEIPVAFFSGGGWFYGRLEGLGHKNVELRRAQYAAAEDPDRSLGLAQRIVSAKVANCRTLVRRNHPEPPREVLEGLDGYRTRVWESLALEELLGMEGTAARLYFSAFDGMLKPGTESNGDMRLNFETRNRRPPTDPINALLSFTYALLAKEWTITLALVGFDPYLGFYHQPRYGRPALALDMMEEFRPLVADSTVLQVVNTGAIRSKDFVRTGVGVAMDATARKRLIEAYERRMDQLVTHPVFGYRISYRRVLEVQARLLARHLLGELPEFPEFTTR